MYDFLIHCRKFDKNLQKGDKEKVLQFRHCWVKQKFSSNAFEIETVPSHIIKVQ